MTTPNIVPKFNEEGRVGRPNRRFSELHGKFIYSDTLVLSVPEGQVIPQITGQSEPSLNHLYFDNGRVVHGDNIIAWKSEIDELKTVMDALLGDGSNGLSTLSSVVQSIQDLNVGEDSFVELVSKINAIEADYVTSSDITNLQSVDDLTARVSNTEDRLTALENQDTLVSNTVTSQGEAITTLSSRADSADQATSSLSNTVTALSTTVGENQVALNDSIVSAVGRISTLEVTTVPTIAQNVANLTTTFEAKVASDQTEFQTLSTNITGLSNALDQSNTDRIAEIGSINQTITVLNSDLNTGLAGKVGTTDFAGLFSSNLTANKDSLLADYATSAEVTSQLASKVSADQFSSLLGESFPTLSDSLLADYATNSSVTQTLSSSLAGYATTDSVTTALSDYATNASLSSSLAGYVTNDGLSSTLQSYPTQSSLATTLGGYTTTSALNTTLSSYTTTSALNTTLSSYATTNSVNTTLSNYPTNESLSTTLNGYVADGEVASKFSAALTEENLGSGGSLSNLTNFVSGVSQDATSAAINNLTLDDINSSSDTVDWSAYSLNVGALNIWSPNTFTCADPNIELNVDQTVEYLLEVQGGITWKRGDEPHDAAFLWNEELKYFEVRQADEHIHKVVIETDLIPLNTSISSISSELASSIAELTASINSNSELVSSTEAALTSKINADVSDLRTSLEASIAQVQDAVSVATTTSSNNLSSAMGEHIASNNPHSITKSDVGLSNVENIGLSSWAGTSNISTVGTITQGTWNGAPIDSIADGIVNPSKIDSTVTDPYIFQNISVQGQLTVSGDTIQVSTTEVNIGDNIIRLNADAVGSPTEDAGFEIERGDAPNVGLTWKESLQHWSLGDKSLEASGLHNSGSVEVEGSQIELKGPVNIVDSLSVPHIDITSNMSFNTASSMVAMNTDARSPQYPAAGTDINGVSQQDISLVTTFATDNNSEQSNDSGLKVVLGGADENDEFKYAFLFWDASESTWRLSESAPTTAEKNGNIARTEIVDDTSGVFDIIHSGHVGSTGLSSMGNTKLQQYSADLDDISGLTPSNDDFLVRSNGSWSNLTVANVKTLLAYDTDGISEGSNQYFTQARARGSISVGGDLSYNSNTGVISFTEVGLTGKTTDNLTEGSSNLYHTTGRVRGAISVSGDLTYNANTGVISFTEVGFTGKTTDNLTEGSSNLYHTATRARSAISVGGDLSYNSSTGVISYSTPTLYDSDDFSTDLGATDTDSLSEGSTNLYFTNSRARGAISAGGSLSYNSTTGALSYTTPNSDGITEGSGNLYHTTSRARSTISAGGDLSYNSGTGIMSYSTPNSDGIDEGSSNLYHTTARARGAISAGGDLSYNSGTGIISFTERTDAEVKNLAATQIGSSTTDDITEGSSNLYWTNARSRGAVSASGDISYDNQTGIFSFTERTNQEIIDLVGTPSNTDDLTEGSSNLYHTTDRVRDAVSAGGDLSYDSNTGVFSFTERTNADVTTLANSAFDTKLSESDTDSLAEGSTNLYHTTDRVRSAISAGSGISIQAGSISIDADQSSVISKLNVKDLFQKGSAWSRSVTSSDGDTVTSIQFGYNIDGHTGPWKVSRDISFSGGELNQSVVYQLSDGIDEYKSLPDINFNLTSSTSGNDTVHSLTLA